MQHMFEESRPLPSIVLDAKTRNLGSYNTQAVYQYGNYAVKIIPADDHTYYVSEIAILRRCKSPYIIPILGICRVKNQVRICMPVARGDCEDIRLTEAQKTIFPIQLLRAVSYLADRGIAHRDIKPANVLVMNDTTLNLCDFGSGLDNPDSITHEIVTLWYRAPEILLGDSKLVQDYYTRADVWALGGTVYKMLTGNTFIRGGSEIQMLFEIFRKFGTPTDPYWTGLPEWNESFPNWKSDLDIFAAIQSYPEPIGNIVKRSLTMNPHDRPTATELLADIETLPPPPGHRIKYPAVSCTEERTNILLWLIDVCYDKTLDKRVHALTSYIYDTINPTANHRLIVCAALHIACSHVMNSLIPLLEDYVSIEDNNFTVDELAQAINDVYSDIGGDIQITTCYDLIRDQSTLDINTSQALCMWINSHVPPINPVRRTQDVLDLMQAYTNRIDIKSNHLATINRHESYTGKLSQYMNVDLTLVAARLKTLLRSF